MLERINNKNDFCKPSTNMPSCRVVLERLHFDECHQQNISGPVISLLSKPMIILDPSETDDIMRKMGAKRKRTANEKQCIEKKTEKSALKSARNMVAWLPTQAEMDLPVLNKTNP